MAIERITAPNSLPLTTADYQAQNALLDVLGILGGSIIPVSGSTVLKGSVFNIGGVLYKATSDTAIIGTASAYVKITSSGASATAAFVANLSGVTWNTAYNGYYSGSDLVVFDESLAIYNGAIVSAKSKLGAITAINSKLFSGIESGRFHYGDSASTKSTAITGDLNDKKTSGFFSGNGLTHAPSSGYYHFIIISGPDNNWVRQIAFGMGAGAESHLEILERDFRSGTTWSTWRKIWTSGNDGPLSGLEPGAEFNSNIANSFFRDEDCSVLVLGDSISEGYGASSYQNSSGYMVAQSIINSVRGDGRYDKGYSYFSPINMLRAAEIPGVSHDGTIVYDGTRSNLVLASGKKITVFGIFANFFDVVYYAPDSSGSLVFKLNGVTTIKTHTIAGTGFQVTFPTTFSTPLTLGPTDTVTIESSGGSVKIVGLIMLKGSKKSPFVWLQAKAGSGYQDYNAFGEPDVLAYYLNLYRSSAKKLVVFNLGTNNIYNPSKALSPALMVSEIQTLMSAISARASDVYYAVAVPPRAVETTWPVVLSGYTYDDYVTAITEFARANNHALIRHDRTYLGRGDATYYSDGVHPNDIGHRIHASAVCSSLGIQLDKTLNQGALSNYRLPLENPVGNRDAATKEYVDYRGSINGTLTFWSSLNTFIPNTGDKIKITGSGWYTGLGAYYEEYVFSHAERLNSTTIRLYATYTQYIKATGVIYGTPGTGSSIDYPSSGSGPALTGSIAW